MSLSWSSRKQLLYFSVFAGIALILLVIFAVPVLAPKSTCTDNKQNGDEIGIDCGGGCAKLCSSQYQPLSILWARAFPAGPSVYHALAYVENKNIASGIKSISYKFILKDENNVLITEKIGSTFINPNRSTAIFEPSIYVGTGNRIPTYTTLQFLGSSPNWVAMDSASVQKLSVFTKDQEIVSTGTLSKLTATVENKSFYDLSNIDVVAIVYDKKGNTMEISKTLIDLLPARSEKQVSFTWPKEIKDYGKIEVVPKVNPFSQY